MLPICRRLSNESPYEVQPYTPSDTFGETSPLHAGRLTLCRFCIWNSSASGHATAPTRKNDRAYRPSSVCPSGSHLPPGEGIPQMDRYTFTLSNRTPSEPRKHGPPPPARREAYALPLLHMEFVRAGHAAAPTRKNDSDYRPSSVCPSGSHLPPGEGIPQMSRYTFTLSNRTPSEPRKRGPPPPTRREAAPHRKPPRNSCASGHATAPTRKNDSDYRPSSVCPSGSHLPPGEGIPQMGRYTFTLSNRTPSTLTSGLREKFRERGKIEVEFMGVLCYDNAVSIWACCALK